MTLAANWTSRYSATRAIVLTNPEAPTAVAVNSTFLGFAATDVTAELLNVGLVYSDSDPQIVNCAVLGVTAWLLDHGPDPAGDFLQKWRDSALQRLRLATSQNRVLPQSTSELTIPSEKPDGVSEIHPDFGRTGFFDRVIVGSAGTGLDTDTPDDF